MENNNTEQDIIIFGFDTNCETHSKWTDNFSWFSVFWSREEQETSLGHLPENKIDSRTPYYRRYYFFNENDRNDFADEYIQKRRTI